MKRLRQSLAIIALILSACACAPRKWNSDDRAEYFYTCREAGGNDSFCACVTRALQYYAKDPEKVTEAQASKAVMICLPGPVDLDEDEVQKT